MTGRVLQMEKEGLVLVRQAVGKWYLSSDQGKIP